MQAPSRQRQCIIDAGTVDAGTRQRQRHCVIDTVTIDAGTIQAKAEHAPCAQGRNPKTGNPVLPRLAEGQKGSAI
eukprot:627553-Pelagomonas_calceolata.AAC.1